MPLKFRFRTIPFVAAIIGATVGVSLGQWQTRRAAEKDAIEAKISVREIATPMVLGAANSDIEDMEYRRVIVRGTFVREWPIYLDNRPYKGQAGRYVLMPLKMEGSDRYVLVARGWVARDVADRTKLPSLKTPDVQVAIEGVIRRGVGHVLQLGVERLTPGAIVQNVEPGQVTAAARIAMEPFVLEQLTDTNDGLVRDWPRPSTGVEKHRGYAFQWYALAATSLVFFFVTGFRRGRN